MGNKVNTSSPTECIYDLLSGKISLHTCTTEEIATHFDIVIFLSTNIAIGEIDVTSKQLNDLIQVYGIILKILLDLYQSNIMITDSYAIECYKKGLHALIRLLVIPQISKKVYEQSFQSISIHLNTSNNQLFSLGFLAFFNGFRYLEESPSSSLSIKSGGQEDTLRQQICLQIDKNDIYPTLFSFLLQASINLSSMTHVTTSLLIIRLVSWILNRTSSVTAQLRIKLRYQILQNQETFFELLRHQSYTLSDAVICLLNIIFKQEERGTCVTLQVTFFSQIFFF